MSLKITLRKSDTPKGTIALSDLDGLAAAVQTAIYRIVERDLGYSSKGDPRPDAVALGRLLLTGLGDGSTELTCQGSQIEHFGRHPAMVAASELVDGLEYFRTKEEWPAYLPASVRSVFSRRLQPTFGDESEIEFKVSDNGRTHACTLGKALFKKLDMPEPHIITGEVSAVDWRNRTITLDAEKRWIVECSDEKWMDKAIALKKQRATAEVTVEDPSKANAKNLQDLRPAKAHEPNGVFSVEESFAERNRRAIENSSAYQSVSAKLEQLSKLEDDWNSYGAPPVNPSTIEFSKEFTRAFTGILISRNITPTVPFVGPTPTGGIQFEWDRGDRSLEIEIESAGKTSVLFEDHGKSQEKECNRWETIRLILWVETGTTM